MSEDKSKLQLMGEILQADNKNLELIVELNKKEDEIERLNNIIKEAKEYLEVREYETECCEVCDTMSNRILEILNKGENNE